SVGGTSLRMLEAVTTGNREGVFTESHRFVARLLQAEDGLGDGRIGNLWQDHLLERILMDDNPFTRWAEAPEKAGAGEARRRAAAHDLAQLQKLYHLELSRLVGDTDGSALMEIMEAPALPGSD